MEVEITKQQADKLMKAASITEIQMLMGRYVSYLDKMDAYSIWEKLFSRRADVSVEVGDWGEFCGPEHVEQFFRAYHDYLQDPSDKRGWMDIRNLATPYVVLGNDGNTAYASWSCLNPQARQAMPYPSDKRTLTAIWGVSKFSAWCVREDGQWRFRSVKEIMYIRTPYELGWVRQPDCMRQQPLGELLPDVEHRSRIYSPDAVYFPRGLYNWGPFPPEEGSF